MHCWKSINLNREFGLYRILFISLFIALLAFIFLYVPISSFHGVSRVNDAGIYAFLIALILLQPLHSIMHILPLIMLKKRVKLTFFNKHQRIPSLTCCANAPLTKVVSLIGTLAPTILITIPGIIASYLFVELYVYILLLTAIHIGISVVDFLNVFQIARAPRESYIINYDDGFDILLKEQE